MKKKSLADRLIELTDLDIYIIPDQQPLYKKPLGRLRRPGPAFSWKDVGKAALVLALSTLICLGFYAAGLRESNIIAVYILGVLATAVWTSGHLYGVVSSVLSVASFNFFFTEPRFTFQATDPSYPITFLIMLLSSVIASSLASRVKTQARLAAQKSYYTELLLENSQKLQRGRGEWECLQLAAEQLNRLFDRPVIYALEKGGAELAFRAEPEDQAKILEGLTTEDLGVAKWVQKNNKHAGATTNTLPDAQWLFLAVRGTRGVMGIVGIPISGYSIPDAFEKNPERMRAESGALALAGGKAGGGPGGAKRTPAGQSAPGCQPRSAHAADQHQRQRRDSDAAGEYAGQRRPAAALYGDL